VIVIVPNVFRFFLADVKVGKCQFVSSQVVLSEWKGLGVANISPSTVLFLGCVHVVGVITSIVIVVADDVATVLFPFFLLLDEHVDVDKYEVDSSQKFECGGISAAAI